MRMCEESGNGVRQGRRVRALAHAAMATAVGTLVLLTAPGLARADAVGGRYIVLYDRSVPSVTKETDSLEASVGFRSDDLYSHAVKGFTANHPEITDGFSRCCNNRCISDFPDSHTLRRWSHGSRPRSNHPPRDRREIRAPSKPSRRWSRSA